MHPKRVLIVNVQSLLLGGIESLLGANGKFTLMSISSDDPAALVRKISQLKPEVIILNGDEITTSIDPCCLMATLSDIQNVRLIVLNTRDNTIHLYEKQAFAISSSNELFTAIQHSNGPPAWPPAPS